MCWPAYHSSTTICCDTLSCTALTFCRECSESRSIRIDILDAGAKSIDQCQTINCATCLELIIHNTWQQLHKRKRDKFRETGIVGGEIGGYIDLNRVRPVLKLIIMNRFMKTYWEVER